jgi:hypothetical protein
MSKNISLRELRRLVNKIRNISYRYQVAVRLKTDPDIYNGTGGSSYSSSERLPKYFSGGEIVYYADQSSNWIDEDKTQSLPSSLNQSNKVFSHPSQAGQAVNGIPITTTAMNKANGDKVSINVGGSVKFPNGTYRLVYVGGGSIKFAEDGRQNDNSASCKIEYSTTGGKSILGFDVGSGSSAVDCANKYSGKASSNFFLNGNAGVGTIQVFFADSAYSDNSVSNGGPIYELQKVEVSPTGEFVVFDQTVTVDSKINSGIYIPYYVSPGQTVNIRYLSGTWRSDYNNIYVNPDISGAIGKYEPFKPCIASVPGLDPSALYNTSVAGDNFVVGDYGFINLRMADHDGYREDNDGVVTYRVKITSIVTKAPSIKTYVSNRGFTVYSPIQVQDVERIISGDYPNEIINGETPTAGNVVDDDNAGRGNVAVNIEASGITGEILWHGDDGVHPKQANMYAVKNEDFLYLNNLLYTIARRVELIEDFDYDDLSNQASKGTKIEQTHFDSMVRVANKILEILDGQQSKFNSNDICDHQCQISCQTGCLVACQSCNNGQCHDQKCGAH